VIEKILECVDLRYVAINLLLMNNSPIHLSVFLSSPGDVAKERRAAREIVDAVQKQPLLRGTVSIEVVSYDDPDAPSPMAAGETPQESVNRFSGRPSDCDLTVVIVWSRLGTPIPPDVRRANGSQYESGTVWEFEDALRANKEVWVYRRTEVPSIELNDPKFEQKRADYAAVDQFFRQFTNPDRSLKSGCNTYARAADFAKLFEKHVESFIRKRLELHAAVSAPAQPAPASPGSAGADLAISKLGGRQRVRPLSGYPVLSHPQTAAPVYTGGVQVSFTLAHNGAGKQSINLQALELQLMRFTPGAQAGLEYAIEGAEIQGAGVAHPHVFSVSLRGSKVGAATWVIDGRTGRSAVARSANFFDTEDPQLLTFSADGTDIEELQGAVLAQEAGLYEFRFVFDYSVGGLDRQQVSDALLVYFDE